MQSTSSNAISKSDLSTTTPAQDRDPVMVAITAVVLGAIILFAYQTVPKHKLVNWDDESYIIGNRHLAGGVTNWNNVKWAFTSSYLANYHPLTWLSLQADVTLYGMDPWPSGIWSGGFKITNLALHIANTVLVLLMFLRMTGRLWASAFIAALFGLHPLHVESVAWATERKDVLSTFFCLLAIHSYTSYAKRGWIWAYCAMLVLFVFSLLSKQMYVTLFGVLLLLDFWPLRRIRGLPLAPDEEAIFPRVSWKRALLEKVPVLAIGVGLSALIYAIQAANPIVLNLDISSTSRLQNALHSYGVYLRQTVWPSDLAFFYPFPQSNYAAADLAWPVALLACGTIVSVALWRRAPYLLCGWLWYLGTLVPVIGFVQVGWQAHADRYTYFPLIGIFAAFAFALEDLIRRAPSWGETVVRTVQCALVLVAAFFCWKHVSVWQDTGTLTVHALKVTKDNFVACLQLGTLQANEALWDEAIANLTLARDLRPDYLTANKNLAIVQLVLDDVDAAEASYRTACELAPRDDEMHFQLGMILLGKGGEKNIAEAIEQFQRTLELRESYARARFTLGLAYVKAGNYDAARAEFEVIREQIHDAAIERLGPEEAERRLNAKANRTATPQLYQDAGDVLDLLTGLQKDDPQAKEAFAKRFDWPATYMGSVTAITKARSLLTDARRLKQIGQLDAAEKFHERGLREIDRALELWTYNPQALESQGLELFDVKKYAEARERFVKLVDIDGKNVDALSNLGVISIKENELTQAHDWFRKALEIDASHQKSKEFRAKLDEGTMDEIVPSNPLQAAMGAEATPTDILADPLSPSEAPSFQDLIAPPTDLFTPR